ncbi:MAG: CooT family nickel-binding protein [Desulfovermiculus sp.]
MCEVHVYLKTGETQEKVLESVESVQAQGSKITARNIFGEEKTVRAKFLLFDSSKNTFLLEAIQP